MIMSDEIFIEKYEELLDKGYCNCNEMNCLDNDTPRKILNIVKGTKLEAKQLLIEKNDLQQRIDEAIEFIKECDDETDNGIYEIDSGIKEQLLSILQGKDVK